MSIQSQTGLFTLRAVHGPAQCDASDNQYCNYGQPSPPINSCGGGGCNVDPPCSCTAGCGSSCGCACACV